MTNNIPKWLVTIKVDIPYPKEYQYRMGGSNVGVAISRAYKQFRKELKGKRIKDGRLTWVTL